MVGGLRKKIIAVCRNEVIIVKITAREIADIIKTDNVLGNKDVCVEGLNLCNRHTGKRSILSYAINNSYVEHVKNSKSILVMIVSPDIAEVYSNILISKNGCIIITEEPEKKFYHVHEELCSRGDFYDNYSFKTEIGAGCNIHESVVMYDGVVVGNNVTIGALSVIKPGTIIDDNVIIGCNSTIGSEGFQLITIEGGEPMHITHVGRTHICKNVYIGDNTCVANSLFEGETYIGNGTKIDNLVYIAHNTFIGERVVITAGVILCGSSVIKNGAWLAPNVSVLNKVTIGENSKIGLGSVVTRDIPDNSLAYGIPAKVK